MIGFLGAGVALGLSAGFSPGPLLALVVSQAIRHGPKEGIKVALAPIITDFPIILLSALLLVHLSAYKPVLGVVSIVGGVFLVYLAYENFRTGGLHVENDESVPQSFSRGAMVNALNPHPYLFWITVGTPTILKGWMESPISSVVFLASFFACLVSAKIFLAIIVGKSRRFLVGRLYIYIVRALGLAIFVFALVLFRDGFMLLN